MRWLGRVGRGLTCFQARLTEGQAYLVCVFLTVVDMGEKMVKLKGSQETEARSRPWWRGKFASFFYPCLSLGGKELSGGLPLGLRKDPRVGLGDLGIV